MKVNMSDLTPTAWMWDINNGGGWSSRGIGFTQTDIPFAKHTALYAVPNNYVAVIRMALQALQTRGEKALEDMSEHEKFFDGQVVNLLTTLCNNADLEKSQSASATV